MAKAKQSQAINFAEQMFTGLNNEALTLYEDYKNAAKTNESLMVIITVVVFSLGILISSMVFEGYAQYFGMAITFLTGIQGIFVFKDKALLYWEGAHSINSLISKIALSYNKDLQNIFNLMASKKPEEANEKHLALLNQFNTELGTGINKIKNLVATGERQLLKDFGGKSENG